MKRALAILIMICAAGAAADEPKRDVPDYDGRGDPPTSAGDVLLWVPRLAVAPLYLTSEFIVRRPVGLLIETAEKHNWVENLQDYLNGPVGVIPTALIDLGMDFTAGLYFFWNDAGATGNQIRASGSAGVRTISATLLDRYNIPDTRVQIAARGAISRRDDVLFYGTGFDTGFDNPMRYEDHRLEGSLAALVKFGALSRLRVEVGLRSVKWADANCCDDPSIPEGVNMGLATLPFGYQNAGYAGEFSRMQLVLDGRAEAPGTGVSLKLDGEQGSDPTNDLVWLRAGGDLAGSLELGKHRRVGSLILHAELAEPLQGADVPFTELATLGGGGPLPAFIAGRLLGRSAVAATLQYEWPVWAYLTGVAQVGAGNVFGDHFDGFQVDRMRGSVGMGVRSVGYGDHRFEMLLALGTSPFNESFKVDSVRFEIGGVIGF